MSSSSFSAWSPSLSVLMVILPSAIAMESFASSASEAHSMLRSPPVIFRSSLQDIPLSVEVSFRLPVPLSTRSSFEKMTASVLVSPSAVKLPVTERLLSPTVVTNTLSAFLT